jgi:hypothetical protein
VSGVDGRLARPGSPGRERLDAVEERLGMDEPVGRSRGADE